jgi:hypothetical protein
MSAFGGKADVVQAPKSPPLLTQCGLGRMRSIIPLHSASDGRECVATENRDDGREYSVTESAHIGPHAGAVAELRYPDP